MKITKKLIIIYICCIMFGIITFRIYYYLKDKPVKPQETKISIDNNCRCIDKQIEEIIQILCE